MWDLVISRNVTAALKRAADEANKRKIEPTTSQQKLEAPDSFGKFRILFLTPF